MRHILLTFGIHINMLILMHNKKGGDTGTFLCVMIYIADYYFLQETPAAQFSSPSEISATPFIYFRDSVT